MKKSLLLGVALATLALCAPALTALSRAVGREGQIGSIEPAARKKKVMIVGGGPAGMETARVARMRGHDVSLYEREPELGGQVNIATRVPVRSEFGGIARYRIRQMQVLGVKVHVGTEVTPDDIVAAGGLDPAGRKE